jgi:hypothetical protein
VRRLEARTGPECCNSIVKPYKTRSDSDIDSQEGIYRMKFQALAATVIAATALVAGSALAQATMEPIPNPPEKAKPMMKHHMKKHHMKAKDSMAKAPTDAPAPAPK